jgi:GT2 family glycosyltransferase
VESPASISVVVVAYRSGEALARCLQAIREDASGAEVIVVDNDGSDRDVASDGVRLVEPGENLGFAEGSNRGAAAATGDVLVFLNPDTVVARGALRQLARTLEDPGIGIAMARLRLLDRPELLNSAGTMVHVSGVVWAGSYGEPADHVTSLEDVPAPSGAAMAIRRELFEELGGFTGELFMYLEDVELGWRAHLRGLRVVVDPAADVYHEYDFARHASKAPLLERNRLVFVFSAYSVRLLLLLAPVLAAVEAGMLVLAARRHWLGGKLAGSWWCLRHAPWLLRHRRATQRLRRVRDSDVAAFLTPVFDPSMMGLPPGTATANALISRYWSLVQKLL